MKFKWPTIQNDQNVAVIGPKGSGKSEVLANLSLTLRNALVMDTKRVEHWERVGRILQNDRDVYRIRSGRYVYRVPRSFFRDDDAQSQLFLSLLDAGGGHRATILDEAFNFRDTLGLELLAKQGRASKKPLWVAMQRPFGVPLYTLSEADHFFIFSLTLKRDRDRIEEATGGAAIPWDELANPDGAPRNWKCSHAFVHFQPGKGVSPVTWLREEACFLTDH